MNSASLIAVDIGNTRIKFGRFDNFDSAAHTDAGKLPEPAATLALPALDWNEQVLQKWLAETPQNCTWWIASVNRPGAARLNEWLKKNIQSSSIIRILAHTDLPITAAVEHPDRVGIDRLAGAAAANRLRDRSRPAIVIGVGTAITVDLISAGGLFRGGAILPGIGISAKALNTFTDLLPRSPLEELSGPPPALGTSTLTAIHSGLYWGAVGAMRELIVQLSATLCNTSNVRDDNFASAVKPQVFLTGGAAESVAITLDSTARFCEHLVLSGIALANPT